MNSTFLEKLDRLKNPPSTSPALTVAASASAGYIILYIDENFNGPSDPIGAAPGIGCPGLPDPFNDSITSIVVVSGIWALYVNANYSGQSSVIGPGAYPNSNAFGLPNDSLTSLACIG
jgi:hypothetical protein